MSPRLISGTGADFNRSSYWAAVLCTVPLYLQVRGHMQFVFSLHLFLCFIHVSFTVAVNSGYLLTD